MDETESLLRKTEHNNQAKEPLKDCAKDYFFGIWADKQQDIHTYVRDIRQGRKI